MTIPFELAPGVKERQKTPGQSHLAPNAAVHRRSTVHCRGLWFDLQCAFQSEGVVDLMPSLCSSRLVSVCPSPPETRPLCFVVVLLCRRGRRDNSVFLYLRAATVAKTYAILILLSLALDGYTKPRRVCGSTVGQVWLWWGWSEGAVLCV